MEGSGGQCAGDEQDGKKIKGGLCPPHNSFVSVFCVFFHVLNNLVKPGFQIVQQPQHGASMHRPFAFR